MSIRIWWALPNEKILETVLSANQSISPHFELIKDLSRQCQSLRIEEENMKLCIRGYLSRIMPHIAEIDILAQEIFKAFYSTALKKECRD